MIFKRIKKFYHIAQNPIYVGFMVCFNNFSQMVTTTQLVCVLSQSGSFYQQKLVVGQLCAAATGWSCDFAGCPAGVGVGVGGSLSAFFLLFHYCSARACHRVIVYSST